MKKQLLLFALLMALPIVTLAQGTTWQEATLIESGKTIRCEVKKDAPDAWFKLEVPEDGVVEFSIVRSWDPNEMVGPAGVGDKNYIAETRTMDYRIMFENKKEATAPAYRIRISDELDENVFDVNTVRFGETSHDGAGYNWKMTREGNRLSWDIEGIELPPNVNAPEGEGYVSFSVDLKPGLKDGTQLKNKAAIRKSGRTSFFGTHCTD